MDPLYRARAQRMAFWGWIALAVVVWNGLYDLLLDRAANVYLFEAALHELGRGPAVSLREEMADAVGYAMAISTLWAGIVLLAGFLTLKVRAIGRQRQGA